MSKKYRVVVVGAGMVGASAAYHLAKFGWRDILVVDKGNIPVNDGSTSHAPGGVEHHDVEVVLAPARLDCGRARVS